MANFISTEPEQAVDLAEQCGWLMATEVLAVGIDFSFAPVLDLNDVSDVIGDRGFAKNIDDIVPLARAFIKGYETCRHGQSTGKHFPGHGSVKADSHVAAPVDSRSYEEIYHKGHANLYPADAAAGCLDARTCDL